MAPTACEAAPVTPAKKNLLLKCQAAPAAGAPPCPEFGQQLGRAKGLRAAFVPPCPSMRQLGYKDPFVAAQDPVQRDPEGFRNAAGCGAWGTVGGSAAS